MIRGVWQCQKMLINYCKRAPSKGVYDVIRDGKLIKFAKENPQIKIETQLNVQRLPYVQVDYLNGTRQAISIKSQSSEEIIQTLYRMRDRIGRDMGDITHWPKPETKIESVQTMWHPQKATSDAREIIVKLKGKSSTS